VTITETGSKWKGDRPIFINCKNRA